MAISFADGSRGALTGRIELEERVVRDGHVSFDGAFGRQFLPERNSFERAIFEASFSGPWGSIVYPGKREPAKAGTTNGAFAHSGKLNVQNFTNSQLHPLQLQARWEGKGLDLDQAKFLASAGESALEFKGAMLVTNMEVNLRANTLTLRQ